MNNDTTNSAVRFFISIFAGMIAGWMAGKGWIGVEDQATFVTNLTVLLVLGVSAAPAIIAQYIRPTPKAMEAARAIDQQVAPEAPVLIKTPDGQPDILVQGKAP